MHDVLKYNPKLKELAKELRKNSTLSEVLLWHEINKNKLGVDFHRQKPIGNYIVDFYCPKSKLVIEVDGISHAGKLEYDQKRDDYLNKIGLTVIHFSDEEIKQNLVNVIEYLKDWIETHPTTKVAPLSRGESHALRLKSHSSQERIYQGVKFHTIFIQKTPPNHKNIDELKKWCKIFHEKKLAPPYPGGSFGNLSFGTDNNTFIITGSRIGLKCDLANDCFVEIIDCDFENQNIKVIGTREPSSETMLHAVIYNKRKDVKAIFHGHSAELLQNVEQLKIPATKEEKPYGTMELVESVIEIIDRNNLIMMKNHGFIAVGRNMQDVGNLLMKTLRMVADLRNG
ncbi:MAG: DUF559 domain-containing protein [Candidatus Cloacimonetes bacterium]|nr:DUF559 domain-containing protein [Candidatus Cloacimonadota bacterium]